MSISFTAVPSNAIASAVFIEPEYKRNGVPGVIPQRIAMFAQYNSGKTPTDNVAVNVTSADDVANRAGMGSMAHLMAKKLFNAMGSGAVDVDWFPIGDGTGSATGTITVTVTTATAGTIKLYIAGRGVDVTVAAGAAQNDIATAIAAAINADLELPVTASASNNVVTLTAKWVGLSANGITVRQDINSTDAAGEPGGVTVVIAAMSGGSADPSIATALTNLGGTWYTWVLCPYNSDASLDLLEASGAARIDPGVKKPFAGVVGYTDTRANYLTWLASRNSPWTTSVPVEGSPNHPAEIAAAAVGVCSVSANADPNRPFRTLQLTGILGGTSAPWTYAEANAVEAAGGSWTYDDGSGTIRIKDLLTTYTTNALGAVDESWRDTITICNIQAKISQMDATMLSAPFDRAVLVSDDDVTNIEWAVRPKTAEAYIIQLIDFWISKAWSRNRDEIVNSIVIAQDGANANRLNIQFNDILAPGLKIIAIKYQWSFAPAASAA